jgi:ParB family chromosome partitioning protein
LEELEIHAIRPPKYSLRSDLGMLEELMSSIGEKGLLEPVVVRPVGDGFEVVAGCRRLEACRRLGWRKIPCHIIELDDREAYEASLIENLQHETLDPIEEAKAFKRYVDEYGWGGMSELARRIGKSVQYVSARIKLLSLPQEVQDKISRRHEIFPSVAQELLNLDEEEAKKVTELIVERRVTRSEVRTMVRRVREGRELDPPYPWQVSSNTERGSRGVERALNRCIAALKICLYRVNEAVEDVEDWQMKEILWQHREGLNRQIDSLIRLKKKIKAKH